MVELNTKDIKLNIHGRKLNKVILTRTGLHKEALKEMIW